jgi:hypothetical protein
MPFKKNDGSTPKAKIAWSGCGSRELASLNRHKPREQHTTHNNQSQTREESDHSIFELDSCASSSSSNGEEDTDDENDIDKDKIGNYNVIVNVDQLKSLVSRDLVCGV